MRPCRASGVCPHADVAACSLPGTAPPRVCRESGSILEPGGQHGWAKRSQQVWGCLCGSVLLKPYTSSSLSQCQLCTEVQSSVRTVFAASSFFSTLNPE